MRKNILLVLVFFLTGCASQPTSVMIEPTARLLPSQISTVTAMPSPTETATLVPTVTMTALPTWTPLPTLPPETGLQTVYDWLKGSEDCRLPCWAGITPGVTTWMEAKQLMEPISGFAKLEIYLDTTCTFGKCNGMNLTPHDSIYGQISIGSRLMENKIHVITMQIGEPALNILRAFSLKNILSLYGKPAILLFYADPDQPGPKKSMVMTMVYPEHQFIIKYYKSAELAGRNIVSCGTDDVVDLVILDNREQLMSRDAINSAVETKDFPVTGGVWQKSVEETTGMTMDEFYETFRKANAPCITTPIKIWMP